MKTYTVKAGDIERKWYLIDAEDLVLGRLASEVAQILKGKRNPAYTTHMDVGDNVIVINADKVKLTGGKLDKKIYYRHSGYPGGLREIPYSELMKNKSDFVVTKAVRGMLPHTRLGRQMLKKLHVYKGSRHPHQAQQPEPLELAGARR